MQKRATSVQCISNSYYIKIVLIENFRRKSSSVRKIFLQKLLLRPKMNRVAIDYME